MKRVRLPKLPPTGIIKVLAARIAIFTFACWWVFGLVLSSCILYAHFLSPLNLTAAEPGKSIFSVVVGPAYVRISVVWFITTVVLVGVWAALKGFKTIGKWEKEEENEPTKAKPDK